MTQYSLEFWENFVTISLRFTVISACMARKMRCTLCFLTWCLKLDIPPTPKLLVLTCASCKQFSWNAFSPNIYGGSQDFRSVKHLNLGRHWNAGSLCIILLTEDTVQCKELTCWQGYCVVHIYYWHWNILFTWSMIQFTKTFHPDPKGFLPVCADIPP